MKDFFGNRLWRISLIGLSAILMGAGCSEVPDVPASGASSSSSGAAPQASYGDFQKYDTLHFTVLAGSYQKASQVGETSEGIYRKIMFDTNLLSFKPKENYKITLYRNREEYHQKTGYPAWSGGGTVTQLAGQILPSERDLAARTSISTFEDVLSPALLAHEITHLVFNEFMDFQTPEDSYSALWLNEGLATYEEMESREKTERDEFVQINRSFLKRYAMPLDQAIRWRPMKEELRTVDQFFFRGSNYKLSNVDLWYWQARDVTEFLIRKHGEYNFFLLLSSLKRNKNFAAALADAYPGNWRNLADLESEWKQSL